MSVEVSHLYVMPGFQSDRPPLSHAVGEPADVQHVQCGQVIQSLPPQPLPQLLCLVLFGHHMSDPLTVCREKHNDSKTMIRFSRINICFVREYTFFVLHQTVTLCINI